MNATQREKLIELHDKLTNIGIELETLQKESIGNIAYRLQTVWYNIGDDIYEIEQTMEAMENK
jgi:hypothetical protein